MPRHNRSYFLGLGTLIAVVATLALTLPTTDRVTQIPSDLVACTPEGAWLTSTNALPLPDGSGRLLELEQGGRYKLARARETVESQVNKPTGHLLGVTPELCAVVYEPGFPTQRPKNPAVAAITTFGIGEHDQSPRTTLLPLPKTVLTVTDGVLSPDGQQLAWCFVSEYERPGIGFLRRIATALAERFPPHRMWEVWVSGADGSHLRLVATVQEPEFDGWHASPSPTTGLLVVGWNQNTGKLQLAYLGTYYRFR